VKGNVRWTIENKRGHAATVATSRRHTKCIVNFILQPKMPSFKTISARAVVVLLIASFGGQDMAIQAQGACNADNYLRGLRNTAVISRARVFCSAYAVGSFGNAPLPTYVAG
jgi:hypothetical protein